MEAPTAREASGGGDGKASRSTSTASQISMEQQQQLHQQQQRPVAVQPKSPPSDGDGPPSNNNFLSGSVVHNDNVNSTTSFGGGVDATIGNNCPGGNGGGGGAKSMNPTSDLGGGVRGGIGPTVHYDAGTYRRANGYRQVQSSSVPNGGPLPPSDRPEAKGVLPSKENEGGGREEQQKVIASNEPTVLPSNSNENPDAGLPSKPAMSPIHSIVASSVPSNGDGMPMNTPDRRVYALNNLLQQVQRGQGQQQQSSLAQQMLPQRTHHPQQQVPQFQAEVPPSQQQQQAASLNRSQPSCHIDPSLLQGDAFELPPADLNPPSATKSVGGSCPPSKPEHAIHGKEDVNCAHAPPSIPTKPTSNLAAIISAANDASASENNILVRDDVIAAAEKIDAAVNRADASRGRKTKGGRTPKKPFVVDAMVTNPAPAAEDVISKKPWRERARDTEWSNGQSVVANFPPFKDKTMGYGDLPPPQYMLAQYDCVLLKAHAVNRWNRLEKSEQQLLRDEFAEMMDKGREDEKSVDEERSGGPPSPVETSVAPKQKGQGQQTTSRPVAAGTEKQCRNMTDSEEDLILKRSRPASDEDASRDDSREQQALVDIETLRRNMADSEEAPNLERSHPESDEDASCDYGCDSSEQQTQLLSQITVGTKIAVYWQDDKVYYPGIVAAHHPNEWQYHVYTLNYDDGETETIDLAIERFRIIGGKKRSRTEVQSLTVCLNEGAECWRSPPVHREGDEAFDWPTGWIEVRRLCEGGLQKGTNMEEQGTVIHRQSSGEQHGQKQEWIREFHPPPRLSRGGKRKICLSIDEVKKYMEQKKAQQLKQERLAARDSSSRQSGRRKTNAIQKLSYQLTPKVGTQSALNKIMKRNNRLSADMKQSILIGAVLGRKKGILESEPSFMGANGQMYPDLRQAFGKHGDVKQCSLCKSRVQGNWYCRITHSHLDKPDFDGGNSVQSLLELFRLSVDDLEGRLWSLLPGKKRESGKKSACKGFESTSGWSMNLLSEDLLYNIASFLPNLGILVSFCKTSKRSQELLYRSVHSENLFQGVFLRTFGELGTKGNFERNLSWRERWFMIRDLRRGLVKKCIRPHNAVLHRLRESVGVLNPQDEREAIFYDNPSYGDPDRAHCNGYFAMEILHLPPPPNVGPDWKPPIIVRGDFNGIKIFDSVSDLYHHELDGQVSSQHLCGNEGGGQVLSLIHCDVNATYFQANQGCAPCCFIGDASGRVAAVSATLTPEGNKYTFRISGRQHAHESEVTDMTFVNCSLTPGKDVPILFSACCAGKVYFYPQALNPDHGFSLEQSLLAFSNFYDCPIFSMASTVIHFQGQSVSVLCTGDRDGNIRIWLKPNGDLFDLCTCTGQKFRHIQLYRSSTHRGTGYHLVTKAMFIKDNMLITATNNGDVRFWKLQCVEDPSKSIDKGPLPNLTLRYDLMGIHNGAVELLMNIGDVLLSSGGNDGKLIGWDISTGLRLGSIQCHQGRQLEEGGATVNSCVVDMLLSGKEGSIISLCRDGSLRQLKLMS